MRTIYAAFALLATVTASGGGAETPKEKTAKVDTIDFPSTTFGESVKLEYLQRLIDNKFNLIVAGTVRSNVNDLYNTKVNLNMKVKGASACISRIVLDASQTGTTGAGTNA